MFYKNHIFISLFLFLNSLTVFGLSSEKIKTIYGTEIINEPVLIELINDKYMQRLKDVNQYGIDYYILKPENYTRYDHSLGVFFLVRKYGASLKEQIAALLHDVSHTVFSHTGDFLFNKANSKDSYQDHIHYSFIKKSSLKNVLKKYGYKVKDIIHKNNNFNCLEKDLPDLCADRLEYNLFGGLLENLLDQNDILNILNNLKFEDQTWYFIDLKSARKFADVTIYLTKNKWAKVDTLVVNILACNMLKAALDCKLLSIDDIHYGHDDKVWSKLLLSNNDFIREYVNKLFNFRYCYKIDTEDFDYYLKPKCRVVDPWVKFNNKILRLSELDEDFRFKFDEVKKFTSNGFYIKLL